MAKIDPNLKKEQADSLECVDNDIQVSFNADDKIYEVDFQYHPSLIREMHKVESAKFDKSTCKWQVNLQDYDALRSALDEMRIMSEQNILDTNHIYQLAEESAQLLMRAKGTVVSVKPKISNYHHPDNPNIGEIINVNAQFAAQLTGFGREDGAAFISIHSFEDLDQQLFKGDNVVIKYDEKGRGKVSERGKPLTEKLDESLGEYVDGVKVVEHDGKYKVSFGYNPVLQQRVQQVSGCEFNKEERAWEISTDLKQFVARAVNDMRKEVIADRADHEQIVQVANEKIDAAKVKNAFITDGQSYSGKVLAKNERYILQHTGKDYMALHRTASLNSEPDVGSSIKVTYQHGRGQIASKSLQKAQEVER